MKGSFYRQTRLGLLSIACLEGRENFDKYILLSISTLTPFLQESIAMKKIPNLVHPSQKRLHNLQFHQKLGCQKLFWDQARLSRLVNKQFAPHLSAPTLRWEQRWWCPPRSQTSATGPPGVRGVEEKNLSEQLWARNTKILNYRNTEIEKFRNTVRTLKPSYVQLPNFIWQFCSSNGNQVMSMLQVDLKMPGGR